jgi:hypothetical protein
MRWISRFNTFDLGGSGRVENLGLWEVFPERLDTASESVVRVPVNVPAGGKFLLSSNALVNFTASSSLSVAGELEIQGGARLRLDGSNPPRDLSLATGGTLSGTGTLQLEGSNRLVLGGSLTSTLGLINLVDSSSIATTNLLVIAPGSTLSFNHNSTIGGPVTVNGVLSLDNPSATLQIAGTLTLNTTGEMRNTGTIRVLAFSNNGGTITGTAPVIGAIQPQSLLITSVLTEPFASGNIALAGPDAGILVTIYCQGPTGRSPRILASSDLRTWRPLSANVTEVRPELYRAAVQLKPVRVQYFRLALE